MGVNSAFAARFELQLNYVPWYFHPSDVASGAAVPVMTAFVADVKALLVAKGLGKELVIRAPGLASPGRVCH